MTQKEERLIFENNELHIKMERVHSLAAALSNMLENDPKIRNDYVTLALIIESESETN